jgi:VWFA-related protein
MRKNVAVPFHRRSPALSLSAITLLLLFSPRDLRAQTDPVPGSGNIYRETTQVELVNIDVVVTDTKGKPVRGLTRDRFVVYEDGVPQTITHFEPIDRITEAVSFEGAQAAPATQPQSPEESLKVAIFIDNVSLHPATRNKVLDFARDFARQATEKGGEVMLVTNLEWAEVRLPFTSDLAEIEKSLQGISRQLGGGVMRHAQMRMMQSEILAAIDERDALRSARMYAFQVKNETERTIEGVRATLRILGPVEGRKAMVIITDGLPIDPGSDAFKFVELGKMKTTSIAPFMTPEFSLANVMKSLGDSAAAAGVALYPIHARGLSGFGMMLADESMNSENGSFRNMTTEPTPGRYNFAIQQGERSTFSNSFVVEREATLASRTSLELLASMTGGFATVGTGDFRKAFEGITRDLDVYYALAYQRHGSDRRTHKILVEVPETKFVARFRKSFTANSPEEEARDLVTAALNVPESPANPLNLSVHVYPASKEKKRWRVPIEISVPMSALMSQEAANGFRTDLKIYVRVADTKRRMTQIGERVATITIPAEYFTASREKYFVSQLDLVTEPGEYRVAAAVLDQTSLQTGVGTAYFHAGDLAAH